jgi:hypothetical protein
LFKEPEDKYSDKAYKDSIEYSGGLAGIWQYNGFVLRRFWKAMIYWHIIMVVGPCG